MNILCKLGAHDYEWKYMRDVVSTMDGKEATVKITMRGICKRCGMYKFKDVDVI